MERPGRLARIDVMGSVWFPDRRERTRLGRLVEAAKDRGDDAAVALVANEAHDWALGREAPSDVVVVPVPPSPDRPNRLVPAVAEAIGRAWSCPVVAAIERHAATPRLRDLDPAERPAAALAADYRLTGSITAGEVVLVDDVILTGTTLEHLGAVLRAGGAATVSAAVVARARRA